jgi:hypothetical protein
VPPASEARDDFFVAHVGGAWPLSLYQLGKLNGVLHEHGHAAVALKDLERLSGKEDDREGNDAHSGPVCSAPRAADTPGLPATDALQKQLQVELEVRRPTYLFMADVVGLLRTLGLRGDFGPQDSSTGGEHLSEQPAHGAHFEPPTELRARLENFEAAIRSVLDVMLESPENETLWLLLEAHVIDHADTGDAKPWGRQALRTHLASNWRAQAAPLLRQIGSTAAAVSAQIPVARDKKPSKAVARLVAGWIAEAYMRHFGGRPTKAFLRPFLKQVGVAVGVQIGREIADSAIEQHGDAS